MTTCVYSKEQEMRKKFELHIKHLFNAKFAEKAPIIAWAPGRLEILGNHTDYNQGVVLSVAIDKTTWVALTPIEGNICHIYDDYFNETITFNLDQVYKKKNGDWLNYIKGIMVEFLNRQIKIPAFNAVITSSIPIASGMSSSAALEIAFAYALGQAAGVDFSWQEWARIGQGCENNYIGAKTGLLDQYSAIKGMKNKLVYSDFRFFTVENVTFPPNISLVVANSLVYHNLTEEYNDRRESCELATRLLKQKIPGIVSLRDVSLKDLEANQDILEETTYKRALHIVGENNRVWQGIEHLQKGDINGFGSLMVASQQSSQFYFANSCPELDHLVLIGQTLPGFIGARLSGGGFGGISVHFVYSDQAENYCTQLEKLYQEKTGKQTSTMICFAGDGARVL